MAAAPETGPMTPETPIIERKYRFLSSTMAALGGTFTLDQMVNPHRLNRERWFIVKPQGI
jgi:hypothetical protein